MNDTQTMVLEGVIPWEATAGVAEMVRGLEADGYTVTSVSSTPPPVGARYGDRYRIVATYPLSWMLGGWQKGSA